MSIPQQIRSALVSGDLNRCLSYARLAHSRNEKELIDGMITVLGIAAVLRQESVEGRLAEEEALRLAEFLIHRKPAPMIAALIVIRLVTTQPGIVIEAPVWSVLEVLDTLGAEQGCLSDLELFNAAQSLVR